LWELELQQQAKALFTLSEMSLTNQEHMQERVKTQILTHTVVDLHSKLVTVAVHATQEKLTLFTTLSCKKTPEVEHTLSETTKVLPAQVEDITTQKHVTTSSTAQQQVQEYSMQ